MSPGSNTRTHSAVLSQGEGLEGTESLTSREPSEHTDWSARPWRTTYTGLGPGQQEGKERPGHVTMAVLSRLSTPRRTIPFLLIPPLPFSVSSPMISDSLNSGTERHGRAQHKHCCHIRPLLPLGYTQLRSATPCYYSTCRGPRHGDKLKRGCTRWINNS